MPKKGVEPVRREQLIRATFQTIDEIGMADATVATIAKKAGLSSGIVAHYFGDKDGLLNAAMRQILRELKDAVAYRAEASDDPASSRAIVDGNFDDSQIRRDARLATFRHREIGMADATVATIAKKAGLSSGIVAQLKDAVARYRAEASDDPASSCVPSSMATSTTARSTVPRCASLTFWAASMHQPELARLQRANDQRLFSNLCHQFNRLLPHPQARLAARGLAAMIDGLWLRGSLVGGQFNADKSRRIAYGYRLPVAGCRAISASAPAPSKEYAP